MHHAFLGSNIAEKIYMFFDSFQILCFLTFLLGYIKILINLFF